MTDASGSPWVEEPDGRTSGLVGRRDVTRRSALVTAGAWLAAPLSVHASSGERMPTPGQMEGPFYPLAVPAERDADLLTVQGRRWAIAADPNRVLELTGQVLDLGGDPLAGGVVEIWQCDHEGRYHHPGDGGRADAGFQGFGAVRLDRDGRYRFRTLRPVPYPGRTPHIHVKVKLGGMELLTTQMYVAGDPGNASDGLYRRLNALQRQALTVPLNRGPSGWAGEFPLVVSA